MSTNVLGSLLSPLKRRTLPNMPLTTAVIVTRSIAF